MTVQIAVKLPDDTLTAVDDLVAAGRFDTRSQAVRAGIELLVVRLRDRDLDDAFTEGFRRHPETAAEMRDATRLALAAIEEEPWEKWW